MTGGVRDDVEWIVGEVMRRLQAHAAADASTGPEQPPEAEPEAARGRRRIEHRVVTLQLLGRDLAGLRELVVPGRAVVTPAVRDLLRKRRIRLVYARPSERADASEGRILLAVAAKSRDATAAMRVASEELDGVERLDGDDRTDLVRKLVQTIRTQAKVGVLVTDRPAAAVCMANRDRAVRAIWATGLPMVREAADQIGANLLVLDASRHGAYELRAMLRAFAESGHRCPDMWKELWER